MADECLICGAPLEYLATETTMECAICKKHFLSRARCQKGHYVCDECHSAGLTTILDVCLKTDSTNPVEILEALMSLPFCHMHGPEHHTMVGAALLTAAKIDAVLDSPAAPFAAVAGYGDSAINYTLRVWVPAAEYWNAFFTINENIKAEFDKAGVEMTYPHLNVHLDK